MDCPQCQTSNRSGQKFCGACGHKLEVNCAQCGSSNPPQYKYCGTCGASLASAGAMVLAQSGLIAHANQKALDLLGHKESDVQGKPFSLFVEREDMVVFFSHLNELRGNSEKTSFELKLRNAQGKGVYLLIEASVEANLTPNPGDVHLSFSEVTDSRQTAAQMQRQQDLLGLMFTITENIGSVSAKHLNLAIEDALKKICLFAKADHCFIYGVDRRKKRLELSSYWCQAGATSSDDSGRPKNVSLEIVKRTIVRLRRSQTYVIDDVARLTPSERYELLAWHKIDLGAVMCHLIYSGKYPIGVIGLAKNVADVEWPTDCVALLKFFGQFVASLEPFSDKQEQQAAEPQPEPRREPRKSATRPKKESRPATAHNVIDISAKQTTPRQPATQRPEAPTRPKRKASVRKMPDATRPMILEKLSGGQAGAQQSVFARDDGLIMLTCPRCGLQESVSLNRFTKIGNAIRVDCQCKKQFSAVLEKRKSYRKPVRLDGFFSLGRDIGAANTNTGICGTMVVRDLSKTGLRFSSSKADAVRPGDILVVRFNLDNSNKALIHKQAKVITVNNGEVGCLFEGSDNYDITLGFYFI